jgi:hypothetical protein
MLLRANKEAYHRVLTQEVEHPIYQLEPNRTRKLNPPPSGDVEGLVMLDEKERDLLLPNSERHRADDCREERKLSHEESETYYLSACTL